MDAQVIVQTIDQSTRVPGFPGVVGGLVIPAVRGSVDELELITDEQDLLDRLTANGKVELGYDNAYWSALAFLASANRLYVARAHNAALYGGADIKAFSSVAANAAIGAGLADPLTYTFAGAAILAAAEVTAFTCEADTAKSLDGDYIIFSSPTVDYYAWYAVADYVWHQPWTPALNDVAVPTAPTILVGGIFKCTSSGACGAVEPNWALCPNIGDTIIDGACTWTRMACSAVSTDPALVGRTAIPTPVRKNATPTQVALALATTVGALATVFTTVPAVAICTITNVHTGTISNAPTVGSTGWINAPAVSPVGTEAATKDDAFLLYAINPGIWDNDIAVQIYNWRSSPTLVKEPNAFVISVYYKGLLEESWTCSMVPGTKDGYGNNIYVEDYLMQSNFIRAYVNAASSIIYPKEQLVSLSYAKGSDGGTVLDGHMITALGKFSNPDEVPLTIMMDGGWTTTAYQHAVDALCLSRGDCVGILSTPYASEAASNYMNAIQIYRQITLNLNSSWSAMYSPHVYIYDKYNSRNLYASPDGYAGAVISSTFANYELWYPAAGFRRGLINVLDVKRRFNEGQRSTLYDEQINPIRFAVGRGILIWGQKTLTTRPSSLDRLNLRLLLVYIQPAIKATLEDFLFEFNDVITRSQITAIISEYMENIKSRRGVYAYKVVCDTSNNPPVVIDANEMYCDLYIQPTKSAEIIYFRTIITSTGVSFS